MTLSCRALLETYAGEPLPEWERFANDVRCRQFAPGALLFGAGQAWPWLAVVAQGVAKLVHVDGDGAERIQGFVPEGCWLASTAALVPQGRTSFAARALTELAIEQMPYVALREFGERHLAWQRALRVGLEHDGARREKRERERATLGPEQRWRNLLDTEPALAARIPSKDMAQYLGITPLSLSRLRSRMQGART
jgi:CRP-like cAMP-binding protein